jgi:D-sedoheptulose 7-phosphate isomerase
MDYIRHYLDEVKKVVDLIKPDDVRRIVELLVDLRDKGGRVFFLGVGGSAANASHTVNDFRKICGIEAYTPTDNVSELTARTNDSGWESVFIEWLKGSNLGPEDAVFVLSVGGGNAEKNISANLVYALRYAKGIGAKIFGVVGRDGGYTSEVANACVIVPTVNPETITPHTESFQSIVLHLIASHPSLKKNEMKWESVK